MKTIKFLSLLIILVTIQLSVFAGDGTGTRTNDGASLLANPKLLFEENKGQVTGTDASQVHFTLQAKGLSIFLRNGGLSYQFTKMHYPKGYKVPSKEDTPEEIAVNRKMEQDIKTETYRMDLNLIGANTNAKIIKEFKSSDYINYYNCNILDVSSYEKITYQNIYPKIDWVIYSKDGSMKYDFIVHPGGNPNNIKLKSNFVNTYINTEGNLAMNSTLGTITEKKPISFQNNLPIETNFIIENDIINFQIEKFDNTKTIIIDPTVSWATYYGGTLAENFKHTVTDASGNIFSSGYSNSTTSIASGGHQITYGGSQDALLVKFNSAGIRLWATYYGGSNGENIEGVNVDAVGNVYLTGTTSSTNNISSGGHQNTFGGGLDDGFLVKFNSAGIRQWATYYGGASGDDCESCKIDAFGNIYVVGATQSTTGIAFNGFKNSKSTTGTLENDAFLVKFNAAGVRLWGTYYGNVDFDAFSSIHLDGTGNIFAIGNTTSDSGIAVGGHQLTIGGGFDALIVKFDSTGTPLWSSYCGGAGNEFVFNSSLDPSGNIYIAGSTVSVNNIAFNGYQNIYKGGNNDAFLVKYNSSGIRKWGTYYGDTLLDRGYGCTTDANGNVYMCGWTNSTNNIASGGVQNTYNGGANDAYLVGFDSVGTRLWATYYGGSDDDRVYDCTMDISGNLFLSGYSQSTTNIANAGFQNTIGGSSDGVLVKFGNVIPCTPSIAITSTATTICANASVTFTATATNGGTTPIYQWKINGANAGTNAATFTTSTLANNDNVTCVLTSNAACASPSTGTSNAITMTVNATVAPSIAIAASSSTICTGTSVTFTATPTNGGATPTYQWKINGVNSGTNAATFTTSTLANNDNITCVLTSNAVCASPSTATSNAITMTVNATVTPSIAITATSSTICTGTSVTFTAVPTNGGTTPIYQWKKNGANVGTNAATFTTSTLANNDNITCVLTSNATCASPSTATSNAVTMTVNATVTPSIAITASSNTICAGTTVTFTATPTNGGTTPAYQWKINGANAGTNAATFTTSTLANNDNVTCVLTSNATCASPSTATSNTIIMTVNATVTPSIAITASSNTICTGTSVTFTAVPTNGGATPTYQWKINGVNSGTNAATFTTSSLANNDNITCVLTSNATCASPSTATSNAITMTVNATVAPSIAIAASSNTICAGTTVTFTAVSTNGGATPAYQWKLNGANAGTNAATFTTSTLANNDNITCVLTSNATCASTTTATSNAVTMTVNATVAPSIAITASSNTICAGTTVTFTATPTNGGATPAYQWKVNGVNAGTNAATFTTSTLANNDNITCVLTSNATCASPSTATSNAIVMLVSNPSNVITISGNIYTATQIGAGYQWIDCKTNLPIAGATNQTFTPTNAGLYQVEITLNGCTVKSTCLNFVPESIQAVLKQNEISIYPNPAKDFITIIINEYAGSNIKIVDLIGKEMYSSKGKKIQQVNTSGFANGTYLVLVSNAHNISASKFVINK